MKSEKAKEAIERYRQAFSAPYQADETAEYCRLFKEIAEIAEQEAEERMRGKAVEAFEKTIRAVLFIEDTDLARYKDVFIQKLNEE